MHKYFRFTILTILSLLYIPCVFCATEIAGTVSVRNGDTFQVLFEPNETAGPKVGDPVLFFKEIPGTGGIKAKAGEGKVARIEGNSVWVTTSDSRPELKMEAVILATGTVDIYTMLKNSFYAFNESGDVTILHKLEKYALNGNTDAQNMVGIIYTYGHGGIDKNGDKGVLWLQIAAAQGHEKAQYNLARSYADGEGIKQDYGEAAGWYRKTAEQGYAEAQYNLGWFYANGKGVKQDFAEAARWYRMAAEQGLAAAQKELERLNNLMLTR